jgi:HSP20 family protein
MFCMNNIIKRDNGRQPVTFGSVVDQIFQNTLDKFFDEDYWSAGFSGKGKGSGNVPVNIRETDKSYEMELYAHGLKKSDFHLDIEGDTLTVSFENKTENKEEDKEKGWFRREYKMQSFSRSFSLGDTVDIAKIGARYENGVLYLQLPKKEHAQKISRSVEIQ